MKNSIIIGVGILVLLAYIIAVNVFVETLVMNDSSSNKLQIDDSGTNVQIGVGNDLSVRVVRPRWYGVIVESHSTNHTIQNLYFFNRLRLPVQINGFNLFYVHFVIILLILSIVIFLIMRNFSERRFQQNEKVD